jgi:acetate kinase
MRQVQASTAPDARAAVELFVYRIAREAGALASSLGGLNGLVFTAGIGEHDAELRAAVCARLAWLGVELDADANAVHAPVISSAKSQVTVRVIPTDEERMIALHTVAILAAA